MISATQELRLKKLWFGQK